MTTRGTDRERERERERERDQEDDLVECADPEYKTLKSAFLPPPHQQQYGSTLCCILPPPPPLHPMILQCPSLSPSFLSLPPLTASPETSSVSRQSAAAAAEAIKGCKYTA